MPTIWTSSAASGYLTDVQWLYFGNKRAMIAHYSAPNAATGVIYAFMPTVSFVHVEDATPTTYKFATDGAGGVTVEFSGQASGATGRILIIS